MNFWRREEPETKDKIEERKDKIEERMEGILW